VTLLCVVAVQFITNKSVATLIAWFIFLTNIYHTWSTGYLNYLNSGIWCVVYSLIFGFSAINKG